MEAPRLDSFELNKIARAYLGTLLFAMSLNVISGAIFSHPKLAKPGYSLPSTPEKAAAGTAVVTPSIAPIEKRLAEANMKKGQADSKPCQACHNFEKGAPQDRSAALRCRQSSKRVDRRFRLFRRNQVQGRQMDLRRSRP